MMKANDDGSVLSVRDLVVDFNGEDGPIRVIDGVSFDVMPNEVCGLVGESGSGKSVTMLAVMGLLPKGLATVANGEVIFRGRDLLHMNDKELRAIRGRDIAMIPQDPMTSLNPVRRVGTQIGEAIKLHQPKLSRTQVRDRVIGLLESVGVPDAAVRSRQYPHEYSGGMRQRVMIAMAISNEPSLLIADEPTTALDVTIQAQVMDVLRDVLGRSHASMVLISHDLGLIAESTDQVAVMYSGRIVETSSVHSLFASSRHPYSVGLIASLPRLDGPTGALFSIPGQPPRLTAETQRGCVFASRCALRAVREVCISEMPRLEPVAGETDTNRPHMAACHFSGEVPGWSSDIMVATHSKVAEAQNY